RLLASSPTVPLTAGMSGSADPATWVPVPTSRTREPAEDRPPCSCDGRSLAITLGRAALRGWFLAGPAERGDQLRHLSPQAFPVKGANVLGGELHDGPVLAVDFQQHIAHPALQPGDDDARAGGHAGPRPQRDEQLGHDRSQRALGGWRCDQAYRSPQLI